MTLPGGWLADRLLGQRQKTIWFGGIIIMCGALHPGHPRVGVAGRCCRSSTGLGLILVTVGTGLLKPNISTMVGSLYPPGDSGARRDAGFTIFYMGINLGAFIAPIACGFLRKEIGWHFGFGLAGIGMTLAIIQYVFVPGQKYLKGCGELKDEFAKPEMVSSAKKQFFMGVGFVILLTAAVVGLSSIGVLPLTLVGFAQVTGIIVVIIAILYFALTIIFVCKDTVERKRVFVCAMLFVGAAMFWSGFEQAGSSMNIFARDFTDRTIGSAEITAGTLQSVNPMFIILMAPVMGALWQLLDRRNPSIPVKFAAGLVLLGAGFLVLAWGATYVDPGKVGMQWLVVTYFLHTVGELCLSPVGLSSVTKLAPERLVGQMMGTWFMGAALGNLVAGLVTGYIEDMPLPNLFGTVAAIAILSGLLFLVLSPFIKKMQCGVN